MEINREEGVERRLERTSGDRKGRGVGGLQDGGKGNRGGRKEEGGEARGVKW